MDQVLIDYSALCDDHGEQVVTIEWFPEDDPVSYVDCEECETPLRVLRVFVQGG